MKFRGALVLLFLVGMATMWTHFSAFGQTDVFMRAGPVIIDSEPARRETVFRIAAGSCHIDWTVYNSEPNEGIIQHRSTCNLSLNQQLSLVTKILANVLADEGTAQKFKTLFLGRLDSFPGLSARLAILAKHSPQWDAQRGRPRSGGTNQFIVKLANRRLFFREWQDVFEHFNKRIEIAGVESVFVAAAGKLPYFKQLQQEGIAATEKLPYDCLVWLAVR